MSSSEYPWTPGPWKGEKSSGWIGRNDNEGFFVMQAPFPDFALIALAPEMAEAILRFCDTYETDQWFLPIAEKLRTIGE